MSLKVKLLKKELKRKKKENRVLMEYVQKADELLKRPAIAMTTDSQIKELARLISEYIFVKSDKVH